MIEESVAQKIAKAALTEQIGARRKVNLAKNLELTPKQFACEPVYLHVVSIEDKPVTKERFLRMDSDIKLTKGLYTIQYLSKSHPKRNPKFPYLIGQDLVRIRVTVSGPRHWGCLCQRIPELGWLKRYSTLTDSMFAIAKKHPGILIKFGINYDKYCAVIEERAEKENIDIDHKPLFTYMWNDAMREEIATVDMTHWQKKKEDYLNELLDAEHSSTVQDEIKKSV